MHNPDYAPTIRVAATATNFVAGCNSSASMSPPATSTIRVQFSDQQQLPPFGQRKLSDLMRERTQRKELYYGIELTARSSSGAGVFLNYESLGPLLPLFTSLVWLGHDYASVHRVAHVESVRVALQLQQRTLVLPHFTCYGVDNSRLSELLNLNFSNILLLRGDQVDARQPFQHASDLVAEMRRLKGDAISIGVAAYPDGHPESVSLEEDMEFLLKKIDVGADFIITQLCFSASSVIEFLRKCRSNGIVVPIMVGIYVPQSMYALQRMVEVTQVRLSPENMSAFEAHAGNSASFRSYAELQAVELIQKVLDSNVDVYGFQFYTMNIFKSVQRVVHKVTTARSSN